MVFKKSIAGILMVIIFINLTVRVQGYTPLSNSKGNGQDIVTFASSKSTPKKLVLDHYKITLAPGQDIQIKAQIEPEVKSLAQKNKFIWKSDNLASVKVDGQGNIKAIKPNSKAVITVSSADKKLIASCKVTVMSEQEASGCIAIIDNIKVTKQEYMIFSKFNMGQFLAINSINSTVNDYNWTTKVSGKVAKDQVKKTTLDDIREMKIKYIKAKEAGIKLTADDLVAIDKVIQNSITMYGSKEATETVIKNTYGITLEEYNEVYKELYLVDKYITAEHNKIIVSDNEVKKYYDTNKGNYDKVTVTHILISTIDSNGVALSEDKKNEAKKRAEDLLAKVKAGEDIKALAEKNSEDPGVSENKGEYTFSKGVMVAEFENWAFSHADGDTGLVESQFGYHVMKLEKRVETPYDGVKDLIKYNLTESKFSEGFKKKIDGWKKEVRFELQINKKTIEKLDKSIYGV